MSGDEGDTEYEIHVPVTTVWEPTIERGGRLGYTVGSRRRVEGVGDHLFMLLAGILVASMGLYGLSNGEESVVVFVFATIGAFVAGAAASRTLDSWKGEVVEVGSDE